jgi:hypothetical protein
MLLTKRLEELKKLVQQERQRRFKIKNEVRALGHVMSTPPTDCPRHQALVKALIDTRRLINKYNARINRLKKKINDVIIGNIDHVDGRRKRRKPEHLKKKQRGLTCTDVDKDMFDKDFGSVQKALDYFIKQHRDKKLKSMLE